MRTVRYARYILGALCALAAAQQLMTAAAVMTGRTAVPVAAPLAVSLAPAGVALMLAGVAARLFLPRRHPLVFITVAGAALLGVSAALVRHPSLTTAAVIMGAGALADVGQTYLRAKLRKESERGPRDGHTNS